MVSVLRSRARWRRADSNGIAVTEPARSSRRGTHPAGLPVRLPGRARRRRRFLERHGESEKHGEEARYQPKHGFREVNIQEETPRGSYHSRAGAIGSLGAPVAFDEVVPGAGVEPACRNDPARDFRRTSAFAARNTGSCAGLCLRHGPQRTVGAPRLVSTPSPASGLGSASASARLEAFTEFEGFRSRRFRHDAHLLSPLCLPVSPPGQARAARLSQKGTEGGGGIEPPRTPPPFCIDVVYTITYSHCQYTERSHDYHHCNSRSFN